MILTVSSQISLRNWGPNEVGDFAVSEAKKRPVRETWNAGKGPGIVQIRLSHANTLEHYLLFGFGLARHRFHGLLHLFRIAKIVVPYRL